MKRKLIRMLAPYGVALASGALVGIATDALIHQGKPGCPVVDAWVKARERCFGAQGCAGDDADKIASAAREACEHPLAPGAVSGVVAIIQATRADRAFKANDKNADVLIGDAIQACNAAGGEFCTQSMIHASAVGMGCGYRDHEP